MHLLLVNFHQLKLFKFIQFIIFDATRLPVERALAIWKSLPDFTIKLLFICI